MYFLCFTFFNFFCLESGAPAFRGLCTPCPPRRGYVVYCTLKVKGKGRPYSITERGVPELICSQPAGDVSHKPGGRLPLLSARPAVTPATLKRAATNFRCLVNDCDLNPGPSAPESSTLTTRLPSHLDVHYIGELMSVQGSARCSLGRPDDVGGRASAVVGPPGQPGTTATQRRRPGLGAGLLRRP